MASATELPQAAAHDAGVDEIILTLITPEFRQDPYPLYARLRRGQPVYRSSGGIWYLTRYVDVEAALRDLRLSNDRARMTRALTARRRSLERLPRPTPWLSRVMTNTDPPDHARLRKLVDKAFTARRVPDLRPRIQVMVDELLDAAVSAGSTMDLIAAFAAPLPMTVICELFGVPRGDVEAVKAWFHQLKDLATAGDVDRAERALEQLGDYLTGLIHRRRAEPGDDIISALVIAQEQGDRFSDDELLSACFMLVTAGDETITNLIGNGVLALLRHPDQLHRLRRNPTLIRPAVDELVRYDSPSQLILRVVAETLELGGQVLAEGDLVYLVLAATNRDPDRFPDPDQLDLGRRDNRHLSFGNGPHFCLGAPLARLQGEVAIGALVARLPALCLDIQTVQWGPNPLQRGLTALPLAY